VQHQPVLVKELMQYLNPREGQIIVDCTIGEGGHAIRILEGIGERGMLIGLDKDAEILELARRKLSGRPNVRLKHMDFANLPEALHELGFGKVDGALFDLGISSYHLERPERGFSFMAEGPLDMRMDRGQQKTAADLLNTLPEAELAKIIREYGEEPKARRIALRIVKARKEAPVNSTGQLKELIVRATGGRHGARHAATRTFQALRIAVNDELGALHRALKALPEVLLPGGRAVVISFHSLEDRIAKRTFRELVSAGWAKVLTPKPVLPSLEEVEKNPRSRSAKLRALEVKQ